MFSLLLSHTHRFPQLDKELHFGYQRNGSLVLARGDEEEKVLDDLLQRGLKNGVKNLRIVRGDELYAMEPHISPDTTAALHAPDAGNLIPYEYAIALAENAVDNGVELRIRSALLIVAHILCFLLSFQMQIPLSYKTAFAIQARSFIHLEGCCHG